MLVGQRLRLIPNKAQEEWLRQNVGVSRFIYNYALAMKQEAYKSEGINLGQSKIMRQITDMKYTVEFAWLQDYNSETIKQAVKDMLGAYSRFFRGISGFPKFKKKGKCKESFYVRYDKIYSVDEKHIKFPNLKSVMKISEPFFFNKGSIVNPRVSFDGKYWYLSFSYEADPIQVDLTEEVIGIDLGVKELAVTSSGKVYSNINKSRVIKNLEIRKRRLQRRISRAYEKNKDGLKYVKTKNILKMERQLKLLTRRLSNIRKTYIHTVTAEIVKTKPSCIVIEDLGISGMMKNKHLSKAIQDQLLYFFRQCLTYKSAFYGGIELRVAPRIYPSSKMCSKCGHIKKFLSLSERTYRCECCGLTIDRDFNASLNLRNLAFS